MIVSIEQVINRTKNRLRLRNTENDPYLEKLINEGCGHLGAWRTQDVSCETLKIDCFKAKLPDFYKEFLAAQFPIGTCSCGCNSCEGLTGDALAEAVLSTGCGCNNGCPVWYVHSGVLTNFAGRGAPCGIYTNFFNIDGGYVVLPSTTTATEVKIWFRGMNVDSQGIMVIYEEWERGLSAYAASQFAVDYQELYTPEQRRAWSNEWNAQKAKQVGSDHIDRFNLDSNYIMRLMHSIIVNTEIQGVYNLPFEN